MGKQSQEFLNGEADNWYLRNKDKPRLPDPVIEAMQAAELKPKAVLEVGCGTGWRLAEIKKIFGSRFCEGIDASKKAVSNRVHESICVGEAATALAALPEDDLYDCIIFGFCLYLVDRKDLLSIVGHTDRILRNKGHIIIHDFLPDPDDAPFAPYRRRYEHKEGLWSYKMDYAALWLSNPIYENVYSSFQGFGDDRTTVTILQKDLASGFPER